MNDDYRQNPPGCHMAFCENQATCKVMYCGAEFLICPAHAEMYFATR